jgi:alpha-L-fucosidase
MMAGTQIGWRAANNKMDPIEVRKFIQSGDYFAGHSCKTDNSCVTPNEYWVHAKYFNLTEYNPEEWVKTAKKQILQSWF